MQRAANPLKRWLIFLFGLLGFFFTRGEVFYKFNPEKKKKKKKSTLFFSSDGVGSGGISLVDSSTAEFKMIQEFRYFKVHHTYLYVKTK